MEIFLERVQLEAGLEIGVVSRSSALSHRLARPLGGCGKLRALSTAEEAKHLMGRGGVVVVGETDFSDPRALQIDSEWWGNQLGNRVVVCTVPTFRNIQRLLHSPSVRVVLLGVSEEILLREAVDLCIQDGICGGILTLFQSKRIYPPILQHALSRLLLQDLPNPEDSAEDLGIGRVPYIKTVRELADSLGCSPSYLTKTAKDCGFSLSGTIRWATFLRGMVLRSSSGEPWSRIAIRLGFSDPSAWTNFAKRLVGVSPSQAERVSLREWEDHFVKEMNLPPTSR